MYRRMSEERPLEEQVHCDVRDAVATVTLNRPQAKNALTMAMRDRLADLFAGFSDDPGVRAVILTGAGDGFCTGAALGGPRPAAPPRPEGAPDQVVGDAARMIQRGWQRLVRAVLDCEKPVVAAVNGTAAGGGAHLVLACDLVLMARSARLIEVFVRRGIVPDAGGAYLLPRIVGLQKAKELVFFGDAVDGTRAYEMGLCNAVVDDDHLQSTAGEWATRLANGPTKAIGCAKQMLNASLDGDRAASLTLEANLQELIGRTDDGREGMLSFMEGRAGRFRGW